MSFDPDGTEVWKASQENRMVLGALLARVAGVLNVVIVPALHERVYMRHGFNDINRAGVETSSRMWMTTHRLGEMGKWMAMVADDLLGDEGLGVGVNGNPGEME